MAWQVVRIVDLRCPVAVDLGFHGFAVVDSGGSTSTISRFLKRLELEALRTQRGNAESHSLDDLLSFPEISGKYLGRAV